MKVDQESGADQDVEMNLAAATPKQKATALKGQVKKKKGPHAGFHQTWSTRQISK